MEPWTEYIADLIPLDILVDETGTRENKTFRCVFVVAGTIKEFKEFRGARGDCLRSLSTHIEKIHDAYGRRD